MSNLSETAKRVIENPKSVWYGPHECNGCGQPVVKLAREEGDVTLDAPHDHHYPNHQWQEHQCPHTAPKVLQPHQQRVVEEKKELAEKYQKLQAFIAGKTFKTLPIEEQDRLSRQQLVMLQYNDILGERIAAF